MEKEMKIILAKVEEIIDGVEGQTLNLTAILEGLYQIKHEIESEGTRPMIVLKDREVIERTT